MDRKEIECGDWLTDKHINYAQALIKSQLQIHGLQSTLLQKSTHSISSTGNVLATNSTLSWKPLDHCQYNFVPS